LIRANAGACRRLTALFMTMKGLPMTYNRDAEDKVPLFDAADQMCDVEMARAVVESEAQSAPRGGG
jgi:argininosuccinate lyase